MLHGHFISYTSHLKTAWEFTRLEQIDKQSPTVLHLKVLVNARTELNLDHTGHIQNCLVFIKQKY